MDGHTPQGAWTVHLKLTEDEVQQLIRSTDWAKQMDSHEDLPPDFPQRMDYIAHRQFLDGILEKLRQSVMEQRQSDSS